MACPRLGSFIGTFILSCILLETQAAVNLQWVQRLNQFQQKYNNSRSDIIFLLDVSYSVPDNGFVAEKKFVNSLLSKISVQPIATRVAVVAFKEDAQKRIDYIDYNGLDKNKCTFSKEFARIKHGYGWATNMVSAFGKAEGILNSAKSKGLLRPNVNTVIVMLTDGAWNLGGSPAGISQRLRSTNGFHTEIISVGVAGARTWQLQQISGTSSNVIHANSFTQFEELASKIRGDQMEKLYQSVDKSLCGKTCDQRAYCSCGTISGIYQCACQPGYYGSGDPGRCYPCPFGTYKVFSSPDPCKQCPKKSSSTVTGSMSVADCKCFKGYEGNPGLGIECKVVQCPPLPTSIKNGRVENCGKEYKETCTFICNENHHIIGETATRKKSVCQYTGKWSLQSVPSCAPIQCPALSIPPHMKVSCNARLVGSKCTFQCDSGYRRNGTESRTCRVDGQWSGSQPNCDIIQCPALRRVDNVNITPLRCINSKTNFDDGCAYGCKLGYTPTAGVQERKCLADGTWSGTELVCEDKTPPTITCPADLEVNTDPGKPYKEITFNMPTVTDNSDALSQSVVRVTQNPSSIKSPYKFPINITTILFTASDEAGNSHSCTFRVRVLDRENPVFTNCPSDIAKTKAAGGGTTEVVSWNFPTFKDNSGYAELLHATHKPGDSFPIGPIVLVRYTARDYSGNIGNCEFHVKIEAGTCAKREAPINGALSFQGDAGTLSIYITSCSAGWVPNGPMAFTYLCHRSSRRWTAVPSTLPNKWPDCTQKGSIEGMSQRMKLFYYTGNCHESVQAQEQIRSNFVQVLSIYLQKSGQGGCSNPNNANICKAGNVKIKCGKVQSRKRSTQNEITIEVDVEVLSKSMDTSTKGVISGLASAVQNIGSQSSAEANAVKTMNIDRDTFTLRQVQPVGSVTAVCSSGAIYDSFAPSKGAPVQQGCVACVAGKYFDVDEKKCKYCPVGTYTTTVGRLGCSLCPKGSTTAGVGTHEKSQCREPCAPGRFSATGLEGCQHCPKGTYQPSYFGKQCTKCPGTTTTLKKGTTKLADCGMTCMPGTYSASGVEPCSPCPKGSYQTASGKDKCIACPAGKFTHAVGSSAVSQCKVINQCTSNPCLNGASCSNEANGFVCKCQPGFYGDLCETEKDECASSPCFGKAACVDMVNSFQCVCPLGYAGQFCQNKDSECTTGICRNGGKCSETPDGFACSCAAGFNGRYCERTINECASMPCQNSARCIDSANGFKCECPVGFSGKYCEDNVDNCEKNKQCLNGAVCVDGDNDFSCSCKAGYAGSRCEVDIDECASNPCRNGGTCVDKVNGYKCNCAPTFFGPTCGSKRNDMNFDLVFDREVQGYSESHLDNKLSAFTLSFWMKGVPDDIEAGTAVSYAVDVGDSFVDNALVMRDPDSFIMVLMGKDLETMVSVNDGGWHHVAVTWSSTNGAYAAYQDGIKMAFGVNFQTGQNIPAGGIFLLGQEQDEVGRNFSMGEAFYGSMSQLNLWNKVLPENEIIELSRYRCPGIIGNELAWSDFLAKQVEIKKVTQFCNVKNTQFSTWRSASKSNGVVHVPAACSNAKSAHCMSKTDQTIKGTAVLGAICSSAGFTCKDSDQTKKDPSNPTRCSDFKARFECPYTKGSSSCSSSPCKNGGSCVETISGYSCNCKDGYKGSDCSVAVPCHRIKAIAHGKVSVSGNRFTFTCDAHYKLSGSGSLTCRAGSLSGAVPSCVDINECATSNGGCNQKCVNTDGGFKCKCNRGYRLVNSQCVNIDECAEKKHNCQHGCVDSPGSYRCLCPGGLKLSADLRSCEDVNECVTGTHACKQHCINKLGSYSCGCNPGYVLAGDKKTCNRKSCSALQSPSSGAVTAPDNLFGTSATYKCNSGYKLTKSARRTCEENGQWSGEQPSCTSVSCVALGSIINGGFTHGGTSYGSKYNYKCNSGYRLIGSGQRTCQQDGSWSGKMPRCVRSTCSPLPSPPNGKVVGTSTVSGASVLFFCNIGFMLSSSSSNFRTCQTSGSYSGSQPTCIAVRCPAHGSLANGVIRSTGDTMGKKLTYTCNTGYGLSGKGERVCQGNGQWTGDAPTCVFGTCGYPGVPTNGAANGTDYSYGKKVSYTCSSGYRLVGDSVRLCLQSGKWTGSTPACQEIVCPSIGAPANGVKQGNENKFGKSVVFDCNAGYSLRGSRVRTCQLNGQWDGTQTTCQAGICGSSGLLGPRGSISSPNYPNGYGLNEYCRWAISVANQKKASVQIKNLKTDKTFDSLEISDGANGRVIARLSGLLPKPITYTSASNKLDLKFISDGKSAGAVEGFEANYLASTCGGVVAKIGESFQSPNYPMNYPHGVTCVWQIAFNEPIELDFEAFKTVDNHDKLEIWSSLTSVNAASWIGEYYGSFGSLLRVTSGTGHMYIKFTTDAYYASHGFKATVRKSSSLRKK